MKTIIKFLMCLSVLLLFTFSACKKKKNEPPPSDPPPATNTQELTTTIKLLLTDSATNTIYTYLYKDPDGDGGQASFYGPGTTSTSTQSDSVFTLIANKTYFCEILLLDETKNPIDTISNEVEEEGVDHMFFFNSLNPAGTPYMVTLPGSNINITYKDLDAGSPQKGIGLHTRWRTNAVVLSKNPINIILKHQAGLKNGTITPGDTDVDVSFKVIVN